MIRVPLWLVLILMLGNLISAQGQALTPVTGRVTDETGQPLPGVTVVIKGTTNGTTTSAEGDLQVVGT